jgi:tRNA (guanosine-2'-O-)-methyltransferase
MWLAGATPDLTSSSVQKTALGTDRYLVAHRCPTGAEAVEAARGAGFVVVGIELADEAVALHELELPVDGAVCLAVGHEDHGLSKGCLAACDHVAYLPMLGRVGSLNVATAAAIALYEVRRRSW